MTPQLVGHQGTNYQAYKTSPAPSLSFNIYQSSLSIDHNSEFVDDKHLWNCLWVNKIDNPRLDMTCMSMPLGKGLIFSAEYRILFMKNVLYCLYKCPKRERKKAETFDQSKEKDKKDSCPCT